MFKFGRYWRTRIRLSPGDRLWLRNSLGPANTLWRDAFRQLLRHRLAMFGAFVLLIVVVMGLFGPVIAPYDPNGMDFADRFANPSLDRWMGTDDFGRDIFSRIIV